jgi:ribose transport system permease protein
MIKNNILKKLTSKRESTIFLGLIALCIFLSIASPSFTKVANILNIGRQAAILGILACGMGTIMISGNIDLSLGSIYGLTAVVTALVLKSGLPTPVAILLGLSVGTITGLINGFLVVKVGLSAFITTFGMSYILRGLNLIITNGYPITLAVSNITPETHKFFFFLGQGTVFSIPMQLIFVIVIFIITYFMVHKTTFGKHVYAIGGSERAAYISGVNVQGVRIITFLLTGFLASLSGILNLGFIGSIIPTSGQGLEFEVFATVVIGGTPMAGGEGSVIGTVAGVLLFQVLKNGLVLLGVTAYWQTFVIGIITIIAVAYDSLVQKQKMLKVV